MPQLLHSMMVSASDWMKMHAIRELLLEFFAASGDFTRRLTDVEANSKFSSPFAGPEDYFSVCTD